MGVSGKELDRVVQVRERLSGGDGGNDLRRYENDELGVVLLSLYGLEELAQDRDVAEERDFLEGPGLCIVEQAADDEALSVLKLDLGVDGADVDGRDVEAGYLDRVREIQRADLRREKS